MPRGRRLSQFFLAAHVRTQDFGDADAAVFAQVVLQEGDQHARRRDHGVVQGVGKVGPAVFPLHADLQAAGLGIAQVRAGTDLEILLLAGAPGLDVAGFDLQVGQVAGAALQLADRDVERAEEFIKR